MSLLSRKSPVPFFRILHFLVSAFILATFILMITVLSKEIIHFIYPRLPLTFPFLRQSVAPNVSLLSSVNPPQKVIKYQFAVLSDVHEDWFNLDKALSIISEYKQIEDIYILGDLTNVGDLDALTEASLVLLNYDKNYHILPGDHDVATTLDTSNFYAVFPNTPVLAGLKDKPVLMLDNSANYTPISTAVYNNFIANLPSKQIVLLSQPLYTDLLHYPFNKMYMGSTKEEPSSSFLLERQQQVLSQRNVLWETLQKSPDLQLVISGDHHKSSELLDPENLSILHVTVGAVTSKVNDFPQKAVQAPQFTIVTLYDDNSYTLDEVLIE